VPRRVEGEVLGAGMQRRPGRLPPRLAGHQHRLGPFSRDLDAQRYLARPLRARAQGSFLPVRSGTTSTSDSLSPFERLPEAPIVGRRVPRRCSHDVSERRCRSLDSRTTRPPTNAVPLPERPSDMPPFRDVRFAQVPGTVRTVRTVRRCTFRARGLGKSSRRKGGKVLQKARSHSCENQHSRGASRQCCGCQNSRRRFRKFHVRSRADENPIPFGNSLDVLDFKFAIYRFDHFRHHDQKCVRSFLVSMGMESMDK
jgi:hypothetical protein